MTFKIYVNKTEASTEVPPDMIASINGPTSRKVAKGMRVDKAALPILRMLQTKPDGHWHRIESIRTVLIERGIVGEDSTEDTVGANGRDLRKIGYIVSTGKIKSERSNTRHIAIQLRGWSKQNQVRRKRDYDIVQASKYKTLKKPALILRIHRLEKKLDL